MRPTPYTSLLQNRLLSVAGSDADGPDHRLRATSGPTAKDERHMQGVRNICVCVCVSARVVVGRVRAAQWTVSRHDACTYRPRR